jgi:hypothetical protein
MCVILSGLGARAQQQVASDRFVTPGTRGEPFLVVPPLPTESDDVILAIARQARVPMGLELAPETAFGRATPWLQREVRDRTKVSLAGMTVRDALNTVVQNDPRYSWTQKNETFVVRPVNAWTDPDAPLNRAIADFSMEDTELDVLLARIAVLLGMSYVARERFGVGPLRRVSVNVPSGTILDVLNTIVTEHGSMSWEVRFQCPSLRDQANALRVRLIAFDGYGVGVCVPQVAR